jgi:diaminohydroxyphosphoribosylaminopyrimidine deaminase / 5-amino-6-(5-phosphoribosylamino)uracil reductase
MSGSPATRGRPSVTLKLATSLDGRIATAGGHSKWITGEAARAEVHRLRAVHEAVLVGSNTVLADDPELTARTDPPPEKQPLRIVADSRARVPANAKIFCTIDKGPIAIATVETTNLDHWPSDRGIQYWMVAKDPKTDSLSVEELLNSASRAGIASLMIEGGGQLAASFVKAGLIDRIEWFRAPSLLGGDGLPCLGGLGLETVASAPTYVRVGVREVGVDLWESYVRKN